MDQKDRPLLVGAQAGEPNGVLIWRTIRQYFIERGVPLDYALFSTYDALDAALLSGAIDIAWNAPLAHARTLLRSGGACRTLAMRDTDREVASVILARADAPIASLSDLRGKRVAFGPPDSSELSIIPKHQLRQAGLDPESDCELVTLEPRESPGGARGVDVLTIIAAVEDETVDAATLFEPAFRLLVERGQLDPAAYRIVWRSRPFSHCGFAARPGLPDAVAQRFVGVLASMDPAEPEIKEMMRLEHLSAWVPADDAGWQDLINAIKDAELVGSS
ncbi:MAG: phosphate/phosphite/phosphonate ABC transporter substrate-binding protein [Dehalococcoidia bacterium]